MVKCTEREKVSEIVPKEKRCSKCGEWKPYEDFNKDSKKKDGYRSQCRNCLIERKRAYRTTLRGYLHGCFEGLTSRCENVNNTNYKYYGERGIEVKCTFDEFYCHIVTVLGYDTYEKIHGLYIDRRNTRGNYSISNLRIVTPLENSQNQRKQKSWCGRLCTSNFKGVSWSDLHKRWRCYITVDKKRIHLGHFTDEVEAAEEYDRAALLYHGDFACTNKSLGLL